MKLLMISGDRSILQGKKGAFWYTLEEFSRHWERIDVITPAVPSRGVACYARTEFPNVYFHPSSRGLLFQPSWILSKGKELIAEYHHDVMTVHEYPPFYNGLGARRLSRATGIPSMVEIHHIVGYPHPSSLQEWVGFRLSQMWLPRWGTDYCDAVRTVSAEAQMMLRVWGVPSEKIQRLSSLYLDAESLTPDPSINKEYDIAFCARLVANKRLPELLKAVAAIPGATLLVIGDGHERQKCEGMAKALGIENRVTFVGWLPSNTDVYRAIQSAKIFVMNSRSEGGPRVLFEAMALGMPVIATNVGLASEVIRNGENGLITRGDSEDLVKKIRQLLDDAGERLLLGTAAREITPKYKREAVVERYADVLKELGRHHGASLQR